MARADPPSTALELLERALSAEALGAGVEPGSPTACGIARALAAPAAEILRRPGKRFRARLVEAAGALVGAEPDLPEALALLVELLHAGSLVVDDIEDGSSHRRGAPALQHKVGVPLALNTGNWLYFWPFELLGTLGFEPTVELALRRRMTRALYRGHLGQALDLDTRASEVSQRDVSGLATSIARLKTGELMKLAATLAPVAVRASDRSTRALASFGMRLGTALQMHDDLGNLGGRGDSLRRHEDLRLGRVTFVWARLAQSLAPEAFASLQEQAQRVQAGDEAPEALAERMGQALGRDPAAPARAELARAFEEISAALGPHPALAAIDEEIRKLESSYV
jgi:geranylgeranyl pyrophosphate synthase